MSTVTAEYTRTHSAFASIARLHGLVPFEVRLLVAIADLGDGVTTDVLEEQLLCEGSAIRRAVLRLVPGGFCIGAGADGKRRRQGIRTRLTLTDRGRDIVGAARSAAVRS